MSSMNLAKQLRLSSALWASPVALGITLFYFHVTFTNDYPHTKGEIDYAPEVVSFALSPASALAYAAASALAAWESGRLKESGVWAIAPSRSPYRVAGQVLLPVLLLAWLMLLIPVVGGLVREGIAPTLSSLPLHAHVLGRAGERGEAAGLLAGLIEDYARVLGLDHPHALTARHNHASVLGQIGEYAEAARLFAELATDSARVLGRDHSHTLMARSSADHWSAQERLG
ncbi:tetratricopeptide repeat protein [Streptomyces sp. A73]|nr:tetratricopeptide repeat protein [Streptomyces sp. A73]